MKPIKVQEVIYGLRLTRRTHIDLKWIDRPAKEYLVEHLPDGTVVLEPVSPTRYVVQATEDAQIVLRTPVRAKADFVQIRHQSIGLETGGTSRKVGDGWQGPEDESHIRIVPWQNVREEFPEGLEERGVVMSILDCESVVIRFDEGPWQATKVSRIPDDWDRSYRGLCDRPKEIRDNERRERIGEAEWQKVVERRERARRRKTALPVAQQDDGAIEPKPVTRRERYLLCAGENG